MKYDTAQIRSIARSVRQRAESLEELTRGALGPMRKKIPESLEGKAADALVNGVKGLDDDIKRIKGELDAVYGELMAFARRIDAADQRSRHLIQGK